MKAPKEWNTRSRQYALKEEKEAEITPDTAVKTKDGRVLPHPDGVPTPMPSREDVEMFRKFRITEREAGE